MGSLKITWKQTPLFSRRKHPTETGGNDIGFHLEDVQKKKKKMIVGFYLMSHFL